jgi:uncharacterized phiE125 gp8 family phage protein
MGLVVITPASVEPITLAEACAQCRIDVGDDDAQITLAIAGARAKCEGLLQRPLITRTFEQTLDAFPVEEIRLLSTPIQSITSVKYIDAAGAEQTIATEGYTLIDGLSLEPFLYPADGTDWPDAKDVVNAVRIRFVAGFGAAGSDVPADVRSWLLLTIGYLYGQREAMDMTGKVAELPNRWCDGFLDQHINYGG